MKDTCRLRISRDHYNILMGHSFPGDGDEHGSVLLAGTSTIDGRLTLHVREVHRAEEGTDYVEGKIGYRALSPQFIHRMITRARDEKLAYLAVHNHGSDLRVGFSQIDLDSHERGYPALLQISRGVPVGALVLGRRSMQADIWLPGGVRMALEHAIVVGKTIQRLTAEQRRSSKGSGDAFDRQIKMFGKEGQAALAESHVGVIGLGGIGSLVAEYLARLGVGHFYLVDDDKIEDSNLSRVVGSDKADVRKETAKIEIARRVIKQANPDAEVILIQDDFAKEPVVARLTGLDYLFLAADSMRARLVFNALVHQYLVPGVQLGSKIRAAADGSLADVMSANRPVRPGHGCLWCNQLIDTNILAKEAKSDEERKEQAYGTEESNPSVISLNAVAASHAVNDFLLDYLSLRPEPAALHYEHFHFLTGKRALVEPRRDADCPECWVAGNRYGRGDAIPLPTIEG